MITINIRNLVALIRRFEAAPGRLRSEMEKTMQQTLLHVQGSVPPYPPPPVGSRYTRTGTLGKSLGSDMGGGSAGRADVFEVSPVGFGFRGRFGSRLGYAPDVVGLQQKPFFAAYWWNITTVAKEARPGIGRLWAAFGKRLAKELEG